MANVIEFLKSIVKEAEQISKKDFAVHPKGELSDLVTDLDLEIEQFLIGKIRQSYPDYDIVSEEFNTDGKVTDNCFIIDPIDGTINFANHMPIWGIQIACREGGETVASVIDLPDLGEFYYADKTGAYREVTCETAADGVTAHSAAAHGHLQKLSVTQVPIKNAVYSVISCNILSSLQNMVRYSPNFRNYGAMCVAMAFMACGRLHGVSFRADRPWDYEPGLFLCQMAGAVIRSIEGFHAAAMNQEFLDILEHETRRL